VALYRAREKRRPRVGVFISRLPRAAAPRYSVVPGGARPASFGEPMLRVLV